MAKEATKNEGPSCACGRVDLYLESLKQKAESEKQIVGTSPPNQEKPDDSDMETSDQKDRKQD